MCQSLELLTVIIIFIIIIIIFILIIIIFTVIVVIGIIIIYLFLRENHVSNHVVERTDRLPTDLIVNSQGTEIFRQELPRVSFFPFQ